MLSISNKVLKIRKVVLVLLWRADVTELERSLVGEGKIMKSKQLCNIKSELRGVRGLGGDDTFSAITSDGKLLPNELRCVCC